MPYSLLRKYLPESAYPFTLSWIGSYKLGITITRDRSTKLGDYRKCSPSHHKITINHNLEPALFFFVLTHELAHLIAYETYGRNIEPHGIEWKYTYAKMLIESLACYEKDFQPLLLNFAKSPKANYMASPDIVKYFQKEILSDKEELIEKLAPKTKFIYKGSTFSMEGKIKKNYSCIQLSTGRKYTFSPLVKVTLI